MLKLYTLVFSNDCWGDIGLLPHCQAFTLQQQHSAQCPTAHARPLRGSIQGEQRCHNMDPPTKASTNTSGHRSPDIFFFLFFLNFYCYSITVVCIFSPPLDPPPAQPNSLPCFHPPPWFCLCVLSNSSWKPFSHCPFPPPLLNGKIFLSFANLLL